MKGLSKQVSLRGELEEITMMDLRSAPGDVLTQVSLGKSFVIKRNGKPVAVLSKLPGDLIQVIAGDGSVTYKNPERSWA